MRKRLTDVQRARIYCVKHGHAKYVTMCFGYVHCGRCGEQIGDRLGGVFDLTGYAVIGHTKKPCAQCAEVIKKLLPFDRTIFDRINKDITITGEKAVKGIKFPR